jgi:rubrerythrin
MSLEGQVCGYCGKLNGPWAVCSCWYGLQGIGQQDYQGVLKGMVATYKPPSYETLKLRAEEQEKARQLKHFKENIDRMYGDGHINVDMRDKLIATYIHYHPEPVAKIYGCANCCCVFETSRTPSRCPDCGIDWR